MNMKSAAAFLILLPILNVIGYKIEESTYTNLVFLVDGSSRVSSSLFRRMLNLSAMIAEPVSNNLQVQNLLARVIQYSGASFSEMQMFNQEGSLLKKLQEMQQMKTSRSSDPLKAFDYALEELMQWHSRTEIIVLYLVGNMSYSDAFKKVLGEAADEGIKVLIVRFSTNVKNVQILPNNEQKHEWEVIVGKKVKNVAKIASVILSHIEDIIEGDMNMEHHESDQRD